MGVGRSGAPTYSCHPYPTEGNVSGSSDSGDLDRQTSEQAAPSGDERFHISHAAKWKKENFCLVSMGAGKKQDR